MNHFFKDYYWKNARPKGTLLCDPKKTKYSYKIISDPYFKHISIERYLWGNFDTVIYDSQIFDFRSLKKPIAPSWHREDLKDKEKLPIQCIIRDHNDRIVLIEKHFNNRCEFYSPHGTKISEHKIHSTPFNGITLYDSNGKVIMTKKYAVDNNGVFTKLLEENWDLSKH